MRRSYNNLDRELLLKEEVFLIIGAAMEVSNILGCGFLEAVYQEALAVEFRERDIPFEEQKHIQIHYKGKELQKEYIADFVCFQQIILEIKAIRRISEIEEAQILNYLKATKMPVGLIINFGDSHLEWQRFVCTK